MSKLVLLGFLLAAGISAYATEASAVVCARGVHRAGCVGTRGAVTTRRTVHPRRVVVHRTTRVRRY